MANNCYLIFFTTDTQTCFHPEKDHTHASKNLCLVKLLDLGLHKYLSCGNLVMGYEKEKHELNKHDEKSREWKKMR